MMPRGPIVLSHLQFSLGMGTLVAFSVNVVGGAERSQMLGGLMAATIAAILKLMGHIGARDRP